MRIRLYRLPAWLLGLGPRRYPYPHMLQPDQRLTRLEVLAERDALRLRREDYQARGKGQLIWLVDRQLERVEFLLQHRRWPTPDECP